MPPVLALVLTALIWSSNFIIGRVLVQGIPPAALNAARFTIAGLLFSLIIYRQKISPPPRHLRIAFFAMGLMGVFGVNTILYMGLQKTTALNSTLINAFNPVMASLIARFWFKEPLNYLQYLGFVFSLSGVGIIASHGSWNALINLQFNSGDLFVALAAIIWALYINVSRWVMKEMPSMAVTAYTVFFGLPLAWIFGGIQMVQQPVSLNIPLTLGILYLGVFSSVIAYLLWNHGLAAVGTARAGAYYNLIPLLAAIMAVIFLGEKLQLFHLIGGVAILAGLNLTAYQKATQVSPSETA